jgi:hypothetical protein
LENTSLNTIEFGNVSIDLGSLYITKVDWIQNPRVLFKPPWHGRPTTILFLQIGRRSKP